MYYFPPNCFVGIDPIFHTLSFIPCEYNAITPKLYDDAIIAWYNDELIITSADDMRDNYNVYPVYTVPGYVIVIKDGVIQSVRVENARNLRYLYNDETCVYCKVYGHNVNYCPKNRCKICKTFGHTKTVCQNNVKHPCDNCGMTNHNTYECYNCNTCGVIGKHVYYECPKLPIDHLKVPSNSMLDEYLCV